MIIDEGHIRSLAAKGVRIDKRGPFEYRKIEVQHKPFSKPEGSAMVRMGNSAVLAGVKLGVGVPFPDSPNEGVLIVNAEFSPVASPEFEVGPPEEDAIELARVVDRGIRESHAIDMEKLCITEGEKVWMINIDIHILNHDGNLIDASALAATAALMNAKIPEYDGKKIDYETKKKKLPLKWKPVSVTFGKIGNTIVVDPLFEESKVIDAGLTVSTKDDGNICSIQKFGSAGFTREEIEMLLERAVEMGKEMREKLSNDDVILKFVK